MSVEAETNQDVVNNAMQFLRRSCHEEVLKLANEYPKTSESLSLSWNDLYRHDPGFADDFLKNPDLIRRSFEKALSQYDTPIPVDLEGAHVWLTGLHKSDIYDVGAYRKGQVGECIGIRGVVSKTTDVEPKPTEMAYECLRCGTLEYIPQSGSDIDEPHECNGCERQGPFRELIEESTLIDHKLVRVQNPPDRATGAQASTIDVHLEHDLVEQVQPGDRVIIPAVIRAESRDDGNTFRLYADAIGADVLETDYEDIDLSEEDKEQIKQVAANKPYQNLIDSVCPSLYGYEHVKEAIVLQMFGGQTKDPGDGSRERGQSHVALIGDPSTGKSTLLDYAADMAPRSVRSAGKTSSAAGITAAAVRDDFGPGGEWTLEGGAIVKADKGLAAIDELDSMHEEDREALNEALEHQRVSVSKAGINATLKARTTLLTAANPIEGRFDQYMPIGQQIDLDPTLLSRFDLIFTFSDDNNAEKDREIIEHKTKVWQRGAQLAAGQEPDDGEDIKPDLEPEFIRKWVAYAKEHCNPVPTDDALERVEEQFKDWRQMNHTEDSDEDTPIPVTYRKQEALHRLAEASARVRLSDEVEVQDVERAIRLVWHSLREIGVNDEGNMDADVIETGVPMSQQKRMKTYRAIFEEMDENSSETGVDIEEAIEVLESEGIDRGTVESDVEYMLETGRMYSPKDGRVVWYE